MSPKFPYREVADDLRAKIESGELPSHARLAEQYHVADMTIGAAIRVLKEDGLIETAPGLGVFVRERN